MSLDSLVLAGLESVSVAQVLEVTAMVVARA